MAKNKILKKWEKKEEKIVLPAYRITGGPIRGYSVRDRNDVQIDWFEYVKDAVRLRDGLLDGSIQLVMPEEYLDADNAE